VVPGLRRVAFTRCAKHTPNLSHQRRIVSFGSRPRCYRRDGIDCFIEQGLLLVTELLASGGKLPALKYGHLVCEWRELRVAESQCCYRAIDDVLLRLNFGQQFQGERMQFVCAHVLSIMTNSVPKPVPRGYWQTRRLPRAGAHHANHAVLADALPRPDELSLGQPSCR
jgi:hypothetical protein